MISCKAIDNPSNHHLGMLTHWGRVTQICVRKLTIMVSDNGLSPGRRQAIIWTSAGILLIGPLGNFSEILFEIHTFSFKKMHLKMSSAKWRHFCLGLNVLTQHIGGLWQLVQFIDKVLCERDTCRSSRYKMESSTRFLKANAKAIILAYESSYQLCVILMEGRWAMHN